MIKPQALDHIGLPGEERPTAAGREQLAAAEAPHTTIAPGSGQPADDLRARRLAGVFHHGQLVPRRKFAPLRAYRH